MEYKKSLNESKKQNSQLEDQIEQINLMNIDLTQR